MPFDIFKGFPPDRESPVAELSVSHDGLIDIPAEVYKAQGDLRISLFSRERGVAWDYPLDEWLDAIQRAVEALGSE